MRGHVTEIGRVRSGANVGWYRRLVDANDVVPSLFYQVMRDRGPHNSALPNDDNVCTSGKIRHGLYLRVPSVLLRGDTQAAHF